jgi:prepilin-type N-terminal cleavage/methylation domain-containing protein
MNHRFPHFPDRRGTTLIEVLAGLVILGTLLVSVALARGRFLRQWKQADQRLAAIHEADQLVEQWISGSPESVPVNLTGRTDDSDQHRWRTQSVPSAAAASLGSIVVRLTVYGPSEDQLPLASVDFLVRNPKLPVR